MEQGLAVEGSTAGADATAAARRSGQAAPASGAAAAIATGAVDGGGAACRCRRASCSLDSAGEDTSGCGPVGGGTPCGLSADDGEGANRSGAAGDGAGAGGASGPSSAGSEAGAMKAGSAAGSATGAATGAAAGAATGAATGAAAGAVAVAVAGAAFDLMSAAVLSFLASFGASVLLDAAAAARLAFASSRPFAAAALLAPLTASAAARDCTSFACFAAASAARLAFASSRQSSSALLVSFCGLRPDSGDLPSSPPLACSPAPRGIAATPIAASVCHARGLGAASGSCLGGD